MDKRKLHDCIFFDFKIVFDITPHDVLVSTLRGYKLNEYVITWIAVCLSLRQRVAFSTVVLRIWYHDFIGSPGLKLAVFWLCYI